MKGHLYKYIRKEVFPTPFCPGCGHGILLQEILQALYELELDLDKLLFVSGIGCAAWIPSPHFSMDTLHTTHGRAIAFATGAKLFKPELTVIVIGGDGDIASIGGNHLIHAARRGIDMTVICANNYLYGMTGGQVSSTTPLGALTEVTPEGNKEKPFDLCMLVKASGASYVARFSVYHIKYLVNAIKRGIKTEGFSFIEALSPCPTQFGRRNNFTSPFDMLMDLKRRCSFKEDKDKIIIGEF